MATSERLQTGIDVLDRKLNGGLPAGSIVALSAPPASQAELFLYELTATRATLYLSLDRSRDAVADTFESTPTQTGSPTIRDVSGEAPLDNAAKLVTALPESSNLILDPVNVLEEQDKPRYRSFMNELQNHIQNTGGLAILHCLDSYEPPKGRDTTLHMADVVFELSTEQSGDQIENRLAVPKFRGGRALRDVIKLELTERVSIDTSRDIA
ncbi:MAG: RAD55 family ATPase [Haloarculaceae archaeon]